MTHREVVLNPARALSLAVVAEAMATRHGRQWLRRDPWARFWALEAGLEWRDLVNETDKRDGYGRRVA